MICFVATGSEPLVALFIPLTLARLDALGWREGAAPLGLGLGAGTPAGRRRPIRPHPAVHGRVDAWDPPDRRHPAGPRMPSRGTASPIISLNSTSWVWPVLGAVVLCGVLAVAIALRQRRVLVFVATSLVFAVLTLAVPVWSRGAGALMLTSNTAYAGRYVATPILLVWGAVIVEAMGSPTSTRRGTENIAIVACCACLIPVSGRSTSARPIAVPTGRCGATGSTHSTWRARRPRYVVEQLDISPAGSSVVPCSDLVHRPRQAPP